MAEDDSVAMHVLKGERYLNALREGTGRTSRKNPERYELSEAGKELLKRFPERLNRAVARLQFTPGGVDLQNQRFLLPLCGLRLQRKDPLYIRHVVAHLVRIVAGEHAVKPRVRVHAAAQRVDPLRGALNRLVHRITSSVSPAKRERRFALPAGSSSTCFAPRCCGMIFPG